MATSNSAQDENALVERVFLRIGSAETDEQLQTALAKFLAPLILKLNSKDEGVRSKVLKLLAHIKTRLKSRGKVLLPLDALLTQFQDPQATPFITNFTILFIKLGFPRVDPEKQAQLVPLLINCLEGRSTNHQDSLLQLLIQALQYVQMPKTEAECRARFPLKDRPVLKTVLLDYFMDVLLLPYNSHMSAIPASDGGASQPPPVATPPGLSPAAFKRLTAENPMMPEELEKVKLSVIRFMGSGLVEEEEAACHFVVASSDTRHSVATSADMELKKIIGSVNWNSKDILTKLFTIFQGTVVVKGQATVKPEARRTPVNPRIRLKIFPLFLKAREASNMFPSCLQVVFDCLFGATPNAKLRVMAVEFVHHMCLNCEETTFSTFDMILLNGMLKLIKESKEDPKLRSLAYVAVGKIGLRSPQRLTKDIQVVQIFFDAMCQEEGDTRLAVQEALAMMSTVFCNLDETNKKLMEALLLQNIDKAEPQARTIAVQYAAAVFPSDHIPSRYILLIGAGDLKDDVRTESVKALRGTQTHDSFRTQLKKQTLPDFEEMMGYIVLKGTQRKESQNRYVSGNTVLPFNLQSYSEILLYLRMCLSQKAGLSTTWSVEDLPEEVSTVAPFVRGMLDNAKGNDGPVQQYVRMLQELLAVSANGESMYCMLEMVAMVPNVLAPQLAERLDWLMSLLSNSKDDIKRYAAELCAIVSFHSLTSAQYTEKVESFTELVSHKNPELGLGALLTLGYLIGIMMRNSGQTSMESSQDSSTEKLLTSSVKTIMSVLSDNSAVRKNTACLAMGEVGRNGALPIPAGESASKVKDDAPDQPAPAGAPMVEKEGKETGEISKLSLVNKLVAMVRTSNESNKTKERAAMCLGDICVGDADFPHRRKAMESLFNAVQSKQVELQFTIGQALVNMAMGPRSPRARCVWTTSKEEHQKTTAGAKDDMDWYVVALLSTYICHANPHIRQGACVWLLTLIREVGQHPAVQEQLLNIQRGFMRMLSENDDVTQDMASKGLGQVMEVCTPEQKDTLVSELVDTLMTGKRAKNEVSANTTVFQSGALGKAPDGGGLSTYKELCAIATDLNQPDLIYKFMHLANHNATWNARKGAAFGFSTIAAQAGEQLAAYLPQIVPRLYRYRFDPNPKIQQAMSSIWNVLVQDNKKTVDTFLKQILDDLMKNLTSNQWRVRESSCLAVSDLLRGRALDDIIDDLPQLWETCLRVRDDIKESVRNAADSACTTLSKVSVKICDVSYGEVGKRAIQAVLPCLLKCSLQSSVKEVRAIGLSTILQISRNAGALLKPNIPVLVSALLEAVSGLEPDVINYLSLHMGTQASQDKLDSARIAASRTSPMMETVNRCVQYVDSSVLAELVPRLVELIRGGIGVSTKAGCSSFIVSLVHQCPRDLSQYAGKLMAALLHGLGDRNAVIRKSYATALGHLVRVGKDSSVEKLLQKLKTWYLDNEDPSARQACCVTLHAISVHSPDCLRRHANLVMPLTFFAMHERKDTENEGQAKKDGEVSEWEEVWNEITPGTEAGIRLYLSEIVELLTSCMESQAWSVKAQAARAMAMVGGKLGGQLKQPHLTHILEALLNGLSGRTWKGKETLLEALTTVCTSCREEILKGETESPSQPSIEQVLTVVVRESSKTQPEYKIAAMKCLGPVLELYQRDHFTQVWEITRPILCSKESNTDDDEKGSSSSNVRQELIQSAFMLLGEAWPCSQTTQDTFTEKYSQLLCDSMPLSTWKVQIIILKDLKKFLERLQIFQKEQIPANVEKVSKLCNQFVAASVANLGNIKYVSLRTESLSVVDLLLQRLSECNQLQMLSDPLQQQVKEELSTLAESGPWELRDQAKAVLKLTTGQLVGQDGENQIVVMDH
ncbi:proteasome adapter and scaffold protein ECM29 [Aplysia californica]|uniref:Proteasome adapter and scaffold protein ECM29 n=1 Tax=Aplysia californica TaxID=6500 RepID=A0ABM0JV39_APLCA|nr:proteasome adapter and scaffold protein ECM29 [Aplysia californica]